ncbi:MAG: hypothetical protein ACYT04_57320 [Nostoc sp.]
MISQNNLIPENSEVSEKYSAEGYQQFLRKRLFENVIKENEKFEYIRNYICTQYPEWSVCEVNKHAKFLYSEAKKRM